VLTGAFATFMAIYESIEYIFCYNNEKKEHSKLLNLNKQAQRLSTNRVESTERQSASERETLLHSTSTSYEGGGEMIPLEQISTNLSSSSNMQNCASTSTHLLQGTGLDERTALITNQNDHSSILNQSPSSDMNNKSSVHPNGKAKNTFRDSFRGDITDELSHNSNSAGHMTVSADLHAESHDNTLRDDIFSQSGDLLR
jgi:hypothetical protein